jgi:hypothetical protein
VDEFVHFVVREGDEGDAVVTLRGKVALLADIRRVLPLHPPKTLFTYNLRPNQPVTYGSISGYLMD